MAVVRQDSKLSLYSGFPRQKRGSVYALIPERDTDHGDRGHDTACGAYMEISAYSCRRGGCGLEANFAGKGWLLRVVYTRLLAASWEQTDRQVTLPVPGECGGTAAEAKVRNK